MSKREPTATASLAPKLVLKATPAVSPLRLARDSELSLQYSALPYG